MRKPPFCICENKGADQLHGHRVADQPLCFPDINSTIPLLPKSGISGLIFCDCIAQLVMDLVDNPKDRLSRDVEKFLIFRHQNLFFTCSKLQNQLSFVVRKPVFGASDQVRHKPGCTVYSPIRWLEA